MCTCLTELGVDIADAADDDVVPSSFVSSLVAEAECLEGSIRKRLAELPFENERLSGEEANEGEGEGEEAEEEIEEEEEGDALEEAAT